MIKLTLAALLLGSASINLNAQVSLVSTGAQWKYLDDGSDQGTLWRTSGFSDLAWDSGPAELGYGDDTEARPEATVIEFGPDSGNKYITTYFRHTFNLLNASSITNLRVRLVRDDGAIVYLNGNEIVRDNLPLDSETNTVDYLTGALVGIGGNDEATFYSFSVNPALLSNGDNLLAVEMHQVNGTSSDLSFDLALVGNPLPEIAITSPLDGESRTAVNLPISVDASPGGLSIVRVEYFSNAIKIGEDIVAPFDSFTWQNVTPGTYTLTAKVTDSSGLTATSDPVEVTVNAIPATTLIAAGSVWRFLDNGTDQGTAWREPSFVDTTWDSGPAELGYGDGDEATLVEFGPDANNKFITTYFRHRFMVADPSQYVSLVGTLTYDDGAVLYLNGTEVRRDNLPPGTITYLTTASSAADYAPLEFIVPTAQLVMGENVFAVEMHQSGGTSSDVSFNLELKGDVVPTVTLLSPANGSSFNLPASITITADASDEGGGVVGVQFLDGETPIGQDFAPPYSFVWTNALDGEHVLTAVATDNTGNVTTSPPVSITVSDPNPPSLVSATATTNEVTVTFSKRITQASATDTDHYSITNIDGSVMVLTAELSASGNIVTLGTSPMEEGGTYTLVVNNIQSLDEQLIAPNSTLTFTIQAFQITSIGSPLVQGSITEVPGGLNVTGAGTNIFGVADQLAFSFVQRQDDFDIKVRVDSFTLTALWAKAGLMARDSLDAGSRFAASLTTPSASGSFFQFRTTTAGAASTTGYFPPNYPNMWLRLKRDGDAFTGYAGLDGQNWERLGSVNLPGAPRPMYVGMALTSGSSSQAASAGFRDLDDATDEPVGTVVFNREPLGPSNRRGPLVVSEIHYNPRNPATEVNSLEFLEVYNSQAWDEDIGGYRISGAIDYTFPNGTIIAAGTFRVVARNPGAVSSFYGISGVLGPWVGGDTNGLPNDGGLVRLRGRANEVVWESEYDQREPWPVAADGAGHSLVLARPSFGEADPRAWAASDRIHGSPGKTESLGPEPLRSVVINEFLAHTDDPQPDLIELYNNGNTLVDLSGAWLSDDPETNKFRIPDGISLPARSFISFDQTELGFALSSEGERIFLVNSNQTRVIDCLRFDGQANGVSSGRYPNGSPGIVELSSVTDGAANSPPLTRDIVINEIMFNPITGESDDEYVELYNKGAQPVAVGGWRFTDGIEYTLPANAVIQVNGFLVVARSVTNLLAKYPQLNNQNTVGDFDGTLSNGGERLRLSMPDQVIETNELGNPVMKIIHIVVDEVTYGDGGRWGWWSDGGGSSLELKDPRADNNQAANWADSDESQKAPWTTIVGAAGIGEGLGTANNHLMVYNPGGIGECLIDDVEVRNFGAGNSITVNAGFEGGAGSLVLLVPQGSASPPGQWAAQGSHDHSVISTEAFTGNFSLLMRAASRGDQGPNRLYSPLLSPLASGGAANPVTLSLKARWLRGWPEVLMLMHGDTMEIGGKLTLPPNLGSPGLVNSKRVNNAGPAIWDVLHVPAVPDATTAVRVTARATDPDGVTALQLKYRVDSGGGMTSTLQMVDNGNSGDVIAGDGLYTAMIPGQNSGITVAFHLVAIDNMNVTNTFPQDVFPPAGQTRVYPTDAPSREIAIRWGDRLVPGALGNYRLWLTAANTSRWNSRRPTLNNAVMDATFVYNNYRVVYNMKPQYAGSPWHRGQMTSGPDGANRVDFDIEFPVDDRFLGEADAVWNNPGNPGGNTTSDRTAQSEQAVYFLFKGLNVHYNYRRYIHLFVNGTQRSTTANLAGNFIFEDSQQPNGVTISEWHPDDTDGDFYKIEDEFWFPDDGQEFSGNDDADLVRREIPGTTELQISAYRFAWRKRALDAGDSQLDYRTFNDLVNIVSPTTASSAPIPNLSGLEAVADLEQWMRIFALQHATHNWDGYSFERGKNAYMYKPDNSQFVQWTWDIDFSLGIDRGINPNLFQSNDPRIVAMWNVPSIRRAYLRAFQDMVDGPWRTQIMIPLLDTKARALTENGVTTDNAQLNAIKNYVTGEINQLTTTAAQGAAPFDINGPGSITTNNNLIIITGTAPIKIKDVLLNGQVIPVTWSGPNVTTPINWSLAFVAKPGQNTLTFTGSDSQGVLVPGASATLTVNYTGTEEDPSGTLVFNEIMYHPTTPNAQFVEIFNRSSTTSFDISDWEINGLDFTFPKGSIITNNQYAVVVKDPGAYSTAFPGSTAKLFGVYDGNLDIDGETLTLIKPGATPLDNVEIDKVRYEANAPWPATPNGSGPSLQLIDASRDNSRVSNWGDGIGWRFFSISGPVGFSANRIIMALASIGDLYVDDVRLVPGTDPFGPNNVILNGDFESGALSPWTANLNHSTSVVSSQEAHSGTYSLRIVATGPGSTGDNVQQTFASIPSTSVYTLSFYYLPTTPNLLKYRAGSGLSDFNIGLNVSPTFATPGLANSSVGSLPAYDPVWLNEIAPNNATGLTDNFGDQDPWLELFNGGASPVSLNGYYLADNYAANLTQWAFPAGITLNPGDYRIVWLDGEPAESVGGTLHTSFEATAGAGSIALTRIVEGQPQITDYLSYANVGIDQSYGDLPDGQPFRRVVFSTRTPGSSNLSTPVELFINEWLAVNTANITDPADFNFEDWIEIYNPGSEDVDLTGFFLTDNLTDKTQYQIPPGFSVPAQGFLLVWTDNDANQTDPLTGQLHANFALSRNGESIGLYSPEGITVDEVTFPAQADNVSQGRVPDGSSNLAFMTTPTPAASNSVGGNTAPTVNPINDLTIYLGQSVSLTVSGSDAESPVLNFSLVPVFPLGATLTPTGPTTAQFAWTPSPAQAPSVNNVTVRATDTGSPALSDDEAFVVTVILPPDVMIGVEGDTVTLTLPVIQGHTYQVLYADVLAEPTNWLPLGAPQPAMGPNLIIQDDATGLEQRFYQVQDVTPP